MLTQNQVNKINVIIGRIVKHKCRRWQWDRQDDLAQNAWVCLIQRLAKYDPARGSIEAFVEKVTPGIVVDLKRRMKAKKRRPIESLEHSVGPLGCLREAVTVLNQLHPPPGASLNGQLIPLRMDVEQMVAGLNYRDREMANAVMVQSVAEYSRASGIPRSTVRYRLNQLQGRARKARLNSYLNYKGKR